MTNLLHGIRSNITQEEEHGRIQEGSDKTRSIKEIEFFFPSGG